MALEKLARDRVGIEADGGGIRPYERATVDADRPSRDVVSLERLEKLDADLAVRRDRRQGDLPALALAPKAAAKGFF